MTNKPNLEEFDATTGILLERAVEKAQISPTDFAEMLNAELFTNRFGVDGAGGRRTRALLCSVSESEYFLGRGMIWALVVDPATGIPEPDFFTLAADLGITFGNEEEMWKEQLDIVFAANEGLGRRPPLPW